MPDRTIGHTDVVHPVFFYLPGEKLSLAELCAARLDGDVVELGEGYTPADSIDTEVWRAASISTLLPSLDSFAFVGPSAAWIHGAGDGAPYEHAVRRTGKRRTTDVGRPRLTVHDTPLPSSDVMLVGRVSVTTPDRTLFDLARSANKSPVYEHWAWLLAEYDPTTVAPAAERTRAWRGQPGSVRARELLQSIAVQTQQSDALFTLQ
ncbi:type IV toxin-antitoxin system AbiEi family antitoxin [Microbacterium sp. YY-01]|uniref:type IV toxin-antitoxin system AbiEi family antitoxin n=1 Tax=Microbacterium sp. YY-01 TaxID=3421634 RepID=UPI003D17E1A4